MSALVLQPRDRVAIKSGPPLTGTVLGAETDHSERYVVEWDDGLVTGIHVLNLVKLDIEPSPEKIAAAVASLRKIGGVYD